jgi:O-antigen/teichoic acid export membrane protein
MAAPGATQRAGDIRFLKDVFFQAVSPVVLRIRSFLFIPLIVSLLGTASYGVWTQFEVTLALLLTVSSLNLGAGMNRLLAGEIVQEQLDDDVSSIIVVQLALVLLVALPFIIAAGPVAGWIFGDPALAPIAQALAVSMIAGIVGNTVWAMLRAQRHTEAIALINTLRWWGEFLLVVAITLLTRSLVMLFVGYAAYQVLANLAYPAYAIRKGWLRLRWPRFQRIRAYLSYSLPLFGTTIGFWVCNSSDKYVVRWLLGIEALGVYGALYKFGSIVVMLLEPLVEVLLPDTATLYDEGRIDEMRRRFQLTLRYFTIAAILMTIAVVAAAPALTQISHLTDTDPIQVATVLLTLCVGSTYYGVSRLLHDLIAIRGQTGLIGIIWLSLGVINMVANMLLIPPLGILGAALATAATFFAGLLSLDFAIRRFYNGLDLWRGWLPRLLGSGILTLAMAWVLGTRLEGLLSLGGTALAAAICIGLLWLTGVIGSRELRFVTSLIRR